MGSITRKEIIRQVLDRMDEICPAEDINISEGELIDRLMDDALLQFLRMANVDTLYNESQNVQVESEGERSVFGRFTVPADFIRLVSCGNTRWNRVLHEGDLLTSDSGEWKMAHMRFREPSPCKPMIAILPKVSAKKAETDEAEAGTSSGQQNVFGIAPYGEGDTVNVCYVAEVKPEKFYGTEDNRSESLWLAYIWYLTAITLQTMGQPDLSASALQHMQSYQAIPDGMPSPAQPS